MTIKARPPAANSPNIPGSGTAAGLFCETAVADDEEPNIDVALLPTVKADPSGSDAESSSSSVPAATIVPPL